MRRGRRRYQGGCRGAQAERGRVRFGLTIGDGQKRRRVARPANPRLQTALFATTDSSVATMLCLRIVPVPYPTPASGWKLIQGNATLRGGRRICEVWMSRRRPACVMHSTFSLFSLFILAATVQSTPVMFRIFSTPWWRLRVHSGSRMMQRPRYWPGPRVPFFVLLRTRAF